MTESEEREWVIWGGPCAACGCVICECPDYRPLDGGMLERRKRVVRLQDWYKELAFDDSLAGVRMNFADIKGTCPLCGQNPAGMTYMHDTNETRVKCSNGHWHSLESWNTQRVAPAQP